MLVVVGVRGVVAVVGLEEGVRGVTVTADVGRESMPFGGSENSTFTSVSLTITLLCTLSGCTYTSKKLIIQRNGSQKQNNENKK